jgi:hypothetical protein
VKTDAKLNKRAILLLSIVGLTLCCAVYGVTSSTKDTSFLQGTTLVESDTNLKAAIAMHQKVMSLFTTSTSSK